MKVLVVTKAWKNFRNLKARCSFQLTTTFGKKSSLAKWNLLDRILQKKEYYGKLANCASWDTLISTNLVVNIKVKHEFYQGISQGQSSYILQGVLKRNIVANMYFLLELLLDNNYNKKIVFKENYQNLILKHNSNF